MMILELEKEIIDVLRYVALGVFLLILSAMSFALSDQRGR